MKKQEKRILISSGILSAVALVAAPILEAFGINVDLTSLEDGVLTLTEAVQIAAGVLGATVLARLGLSYKLVKSEKVEVHEDVDGDL